MICYIVTNTTNGKRYIGATKYTAEKRWRGHLKGSKSGDDTLLCRAIRKYGANCFAVTTIACARNWKDLGQVERDLITDRQPEYNLTGGGEGLIPYSDELRKRFSQGAIARFQTNAGKEFLKLNGEQSKERWKDPEYRAKHIKAWKKVMWDDITPEQRAARVEKYRIGAQAAKDRAKLRKLNKVYVRSAESRAKMSASQQLRKNTPEHKLTVRKAVEARQANRLKVAVYG